MVEAVVKTEDEEERARANLAVLLNKMRDSWPMEVELIRYKAKLCKARYDALRKEGFDAVTALSLCTRSVEL